jgi:thiol-disulfide isomerase/thioredoxin
MRGKFVAALTITGFLALLLVGCGQKASQKAESGASDGASPRAAASEANLAIPTLDGSTATLDQYKGKVVLVNFWATWCDPCKTEIPWLIDFNHKYGPKGLVILGIAMDDEGKKAVGPWVASKSFDVNGQQSKMDYPILLGSDKIADKFGGILDCRRACSTRATAERLKPLSG